MTPYPFEANTRVALLPSLADVEAPALSEISAGDDITCELTRDGLSLVRTTVTVRRTLWADTIEIDTPTRHALTAGALTAYRSTQGGAEVLWDAATYGATGALVVRRGVPYEQAWGVGDIVEAIQFTFGERTVAPSAPNAMTTFIVPLFVVDDDDEATVVAS